jgi:hypothetical protein
MSYFCFDKDFEYMSRSASTPIAHHLKLSALQCSSTDEDFKYMSRVSCSSVVGSLLFRRLLKFMLQEGICLKVESVIL